MPMEIGDRETLTVTEARGTVTPGDTYSVTVTPATSSIAIAGDHNQDEVEHGEPGAVVTLSVVAADVYGGDSRIGFGAEAAENYPPGSQAEICLVNVRVLAQGRAD